MGNPTGRYDWIEDPAGLGTLTHPAAAAGLMVMSAAYFASEWSTLEHHTLLFRDPTNAQRRFIRLLKEIFTIKNPRHTEYWQAHEYPVMLVIRTSGSQIRWMNVTDHLRRHGKNKKQIVFEGELFTALNVARMRDRLVKA